MISGMINFFLLNLYTYGETSGLKHGALAPDNNKLLPESLITYQQTTKYQTKRESAPYTYEEC